MTQRSDSEAAVHGGEAGTLSADEVIDYLRRHPAFFQDNADVLGDMEAPERWTGDGVVDMQRFLLERRLGEIDELRNCAQEVIETSRSNMSTQTRTHAAVLAAVTATDFEHLVRVVSDDWPFLLDVDMVIMGYEPSTPENPDLVSAHLRRFPEGTVDALIGDDREVALFRAMDDDGTLFGAGSGLVRSAAIARLRPGGVAPTGLMALGSRGNVFHPGQGTELIGFLARIVETLAYKALGAGR